MRKGVRYTVRSRKYKGDGRRGIKGSKRTWRMWSGNNKNEVKGNDDVEVEK